MSTEAVLGRRAVRVGPVTGVWRPRLVAVTVVGVLATLAVSVVNIGLGDFPIPPGEVVGALLGRGDDTTRFIVTELRLPRTLVGILVGAALALSGAIVQTVARNPLASPDILGVTDGAAAAAVSTIVLGSTVVSATATGGQLSIPAAAMLGGLGTSVLVYALAWRRGLDGYRLVLVGIGIAAVSRSVVDYMLVKAQSLAAAEVLLWLSGSLTNRGWEHVRPLALGLVVLVPVALVLSFTLGALSLGDDTARGLGVSLDRSRTVLLVVAVGLAALAASSAGPIYFVALVVPQICVRLTRTAQPPLLTSAMYGALLTVGSDLITRTAFGDALPVGIVTAMAGAPYLIYVLVRTNRRSTS